MDQVPKTSYFIALYCTTQNNRMSETKPDNIRYSEHHIFYY